MSQPSTQDNQKVFQSSTDKFKSFVGSVDNVSSSKNMELIYQNITKLFDVFTQGALLEQGSNSEILLRTIYRSIDKDFLKLVQNTDIVDKIADVIKENQKSVTPEKASTAMVSQTTKKVITKTLDPVDYDPMQVMLDFTAEIQNAILQVKLNLSREYEQQKNYRAKSYEGQQEDFDKLNKGFQEQDTQMANSLGQMSQEQKGWTEQNIAKLDEQLKTLDEGTDGEGGFDYLGELETLLRTDKRILRLLNHPTNDELDLDESTGDAGSSKAIPLDKASGVLIKKQTTQTENISHTKITSKVKQEKKKDIHITKVIEGQGVAQEQEVQVQQTSPEREKPLATQQPKAVDSIVEEQPEKVDVNGESESSIEKPEHSIKPAQPINLNKGKKQIANRKFKQSNFKSGIEGLVSQIAGKPKNRFKPVEVQDEKLPGVDVAKMEKDKGGIYSAKPAGLDKGVSTGRSDDTVAKGEKPQEYPEQQKKGGNTKKPLLKDESFSEPLYGAEKVKDEKPKNGVLRLSVPYMKFQLPNLDMGKSMLDQTTPLVEKRQVFKKNQTDKPWIREGVAERPAKFKFGFNGFQPEHERKQTVANGKTTMDSRKNVETIGKLRKNQNVTESKWVQAVHRFAKGERPVHEKRGGFRKTETAKPKKMRSGWKQFIDSKLKEIKQMISAVRPQKTKNKKQKGRFPGKMGFFNNRPMKYGKFDFGRRGSFQKGRGKPFGKAQTPSAKKRNALKTIVGKKKDFSAKNVVSKMVGKPMGKKSGKKSNKKGGGKKGSDRGGGLFSPISSPGKGGISGFKKSQKNGLCTCPICGVPHSPKGKNKDDKKAVEGSKNKPQIRNTFRQKRKTEDKDRKNKDKAEQSENDISSESVKSTIGILAGRIDRNMKDKKFQQKFSPNYLGIQRGVGNQFGKVDKFEKSINKNLVKTKEGIKRIKAGEKVGSFLNKMLMLALNPFKLVWTLLGGLLLFTLIRKALHSWTNTYMPKVKTNASEFKIFGFRIPWIGNIIDFFKGIYNFVMVGVPKHYNKLMNFFTKVKEELFGKKGYLRDGHEVKRTVKRIFFAWLTGHAKKAVGAVADVIGDLLSFVPYVGPLLKFICKLIPAIFAYFSNKMTKEWTQRQAEQERAAEAAELDEHLGFKKSDANKAWRQVKSKLDAAAFGVKPFVHVTQIPKLQQPRNVYAGTQQNANNLGSIMRTVKIKVSHNLEGSTKNISHGRSEDINYFFKTGQKQAQTNGIYLVNENGRILSHFKGKEGWSDVTDYLRRRDRKELIEKRRKIGGKGFKDVSVSTKWFHYKSDMANDDSKESQRILGIAENGQANTLFGKLIELGLKCRVPGKNTKWYNQAQELIKPEIQKLEQYIKSKLAADRFKKHFGEPLYIPGKGWNENFHVTSADLETPISSTPFTEMGSDTYRLGVPADEEAADGGFGPGHMPFKWLKHGKNKSLVVINPYSFEAARASELIETWKQLANLVTGVYPGVAEDKEYSSGNRLMFFKNVLLDNQTQARVIDSGSLFFIKWMKASTPGYYGGWNWGNYYDKSQEYQRKKSFLAKNAEYGGPFPEFHDLVLNGQINSRDNNMYYINQWLWTGQKNAQDINLLGENEKADLYGTRNPLNSGGRERFSDADKRRWLKGLYVRRSAYRYGDDDKKWNDDPNTWGNRYFDKSIAADGSTLTTWKSTKDAGLDTEALGLARRSKDFKDTEENRKNAQFMLLEHLKIPLPLKTASGWNYGSLRAFILSADLQRIFSDNIVTNAVRKATNILGRLTWDFGIFKFVPGGPNKGKEGMWWSFLHNLFNYMNIEGIDVRDFISDNNAINGLSMLLLNYFKFIYSRWQKLELSLVDSIVNQEKNGGKVSPRFMNDLRDFCRWMNEEEIYRYVSAHIRFANLKYHVIDYPNAKTEKDIELLNKYRKEKGFPLPEQRNEFIQRFSGLFDSYYKIFRELRNNPGKVGEIESQFMKDFTSLWDVLKNANTESIYTGDRIFFDSLLEVYRKFQGLGQYLAEVKAKQKVEELPEDSSKWKPISTSLSAKEQTERLQAEIQNRKQMKEEERRRNEAERRKKLEEEAKRRELVAATEAYNKKMQEIRDSEQRYETLLERMVSSQNGVKQDEIDALGEEAKNIRQEAENKIANLPREERDMRLALIRGDTISDKTFQEMKYTSVQLQGSLQAYVAEVNSIPVQSVLAIQNVQTDGGTTVKMVDPDNVDLGN